MFITNSRQEMLTKRGIMIQSVFIFVFFNSQKHLIDIQVLPFKTLQIWIAVRIKAYYNESPYCENYRTVVVETAPIPILRHMFRPASLAL